MRFKSYVTEGKTGKPIPAGLKTKINKAIHKITKPTYFKSIPLSDVFQALNHFGIVALQEDQTEWSGFLTGGVDKTEQVYFDLGWVEDKDSNNRYAVIKNAALALSYFKMPSGKYEIISYVS